MNLKDFLKFHNLKQADFAARAELSQNYISDLVNRKKIPTLAVANRIIKASCMMISFSDLLERPSKRKANNKSQTKSKAKKRCHVDKGACQSD